MPKTVAKRRDRLSLAGSPTHRGLGHESHHFERLVADLSAAFVQATVGSIDQEIEPCLERIVVTLGLDRSTVYQAGSNGIGYISHQWARPGLPRTPRYSNVREVAPWSTPRIMSGQIFQFSRLGDLPPEAAQDRETYRIGGCKSNVTVPVKVGDKVVGAVAFGTIRQERSWPPEVVRRFELTAQIVGLALERKNKIAETLRLQEELARSAHVAAMGELAASLAHELEQPLTAIVLKAQAALRLLAVYGPDLAVAKAALHDVIQNGQRAAETIGDVRRLFKRARRAKSPLVLSERLNELERILRSDAAIRNLALSFEDEAVLASASRPREWRRALPAMNEALNHLKRLHGSLTPRERQVFSLVAAGLSSREVGNELGIAEKTAKIHRAHLMKGMNAGSLAHLVRMAARLGE